MRRPSRSAGPSALQAKRSILTGADASAAIGARNRADFQRGRCAPWFAHAAIYALPALVRTLRLCRSSKPRCRAVPWSSETFRAYEKSGAMPPFTWRPQITKRFAMRQFPDQRTGSACRAGRARPHRERSASRPERMTQSYLGVYTQARARYGASEGLRPSCVS